MSGIGYLWFRFQVITFAADQAQFVGGSFWASGWFPHHLKCLALVFIIPGMMLDIVQQVSSDYLSSWSSSIFEVRLITHDHTRQVWHGRSTVPCTGSHTRWCDAIRSWLPFQLTWVLWAPGLSICSFVFCQDSLLDYLHASRTHRHPCLGAKRTLVLYLERGRMK